MSGLSTAPFVLFQAVVAVLVVDPASFRIRQGVVGFGDLDKLLVGRVVSPSNISELCLCDTAMTYGFLSGWYFLLSVR